jgi:mannose-1-phosphate guanylyltransferase
MKALFLAGGKGTRLQPLTDKVPKPMVQIMNVPLLERTIMKLKNYGIVDIIISCYYKAEYIRDYFGDGKKLGLNIQYIIENEPLGTGGAIKMAESMIDDTFMVINADILSDIDIPELTGFHKNKDAYLTIAATEVDDPTAYGLIKYNSDDYILSFVEKPKPEEIDSNFINAGIYVVEPAILGEIPVNRFVSIEREIFPKILKRGYKLAVYKDKSYWADIGTLEKYMQTHRDILSGKSQMINCNYNYDNIKVGNNAKIHPEAILNGQVYIGDNVIIDESAVVINSVIGNNVRIGAKSRINNSILWDDIKISREARLNNTIITSNSFVLRNINCINADHLPAIKMKG